jgi:hypothetical protein
MAQGEVEAPVDGRHRRDKRVIEIKKCVSNRGEKLRWQRTRSNTITSLDRREAME